LIDFHANIACVLHVLEKRPQKITFWSTDSADCGLSAAGKVSSPKILPNFHHQKEFVVTYFLKFGDYILLKQQIGLDLVENALE
jgi:hypothetical protein